MKSAIPEELPLLKQIFTKKYVHRMEVSTPEEKDRLRRLKEVVKMRAQDILNKESKPRPKLVLEEVHG